MIVAIYSYGRNGHIDRSQYIYGLCFLFGCLLISSPGPASIYRRILRDERTSSYVDHARAICQRSRQIESYRININEIPIDREGTARRY